MRRIVCDECKKWYDYDKDEFCPRCGAFNQPVKTWGTDDQGNVIRLDGVNEQNHAGSFVHSEVHREKRVRQAKGMDYKANVPHRPAARPTPQGQPSRSRPPQRKVDAMKLIKAVFIAIAVMTLLTWVLPLLFLMF